MQQLDEKERTVLEHRYGLGGADFLTLAEVGKKIGVCRERKAARAKSDQETAQFMRHQPVSFRMVDIPNTYEQLELEVAA